MLIILGIDLTRYRIIAVTGAGGKSSFLQFLAQELKHCGKKVLLTTTTHIYHPGYTPFGGCVDRVIDHDLIEQLSEPALPGTITVAGNISHDPMKLKGIDPLLPGQLITNNQYDYVLVEADGAKQKTLKVPAEHEPVLPACCHLVVGVTGWQGIEAPLSPDNVHRWQEFCGITGQGLHSQLNPMAMSKILDASSGLFKKVPADCQKIWLINQLDNNEQRQKAETFATQTLQLSQRISTALLANVGHQSPTLSSLHIANKIDQEYIQ